MRKFKIVLVIITALMFIGCNEKEEVNMYNVTTEQKAFYYNEKEVSIDIQDVPNELLNDMLVLSLAKNKNACKYKKSFIPFRVAIFKTDKEYIVAVKYWAKNSFGMESDGSMYVMFDYEGKYIKYL